MSAFSISLLGPFQAIRDGEPLRSFRTNKAQALLAYLAVESISDPELAHRRTNLMTLLWPDLALESAQINLRQTVYRLRKAVSDVAVGEDDARIPFILAERQTIQLNPRYAFSSDVAQFLELSRQNQSGSNSETFDLTGLEKAMSLYQGDFLSDFYLDDSEEFEAWAGQKRAEYRRLAMETLDVLTSLHLEQGNVDTAQQHARRQLGMDNLHEHGYRQLMLALAMAGQRGEALAQYEVCRQLLDDELGVEPEAATAKIASQIRSGELSGGGEVPKFNTAANTAPSELDATQSAVPVLNLPHQPTPFIGRATDIESLDAMIADKDTRLVTIVGAGGMGKTRLAVAAAEQLKSKSQVLFPDGVIFLQLTTAQTIKRIVSSLAETMHLPVSSEPQKEAILSHLQSRRVMLIFDGLEHVAEGVELVLDILQKAPHAKLLITSRERLNLHEEQVYPISGLEFPASQVIQTQSLVHVISEYSAIQLFLQSAQRIQPDFNINPDDLPHLARICQLVAGIPLAIELAATWVDTLSLESIASEIVHSLDFLETDLHNIPDRHRSMRAVFDASWQRLSEDEQKTYIQLSVFHGHFAREAAQAVAETSLRQLANLGNKSLLQFSKTQDRYEIHELLRQYAREHLNETPDLAWRGHQRHGQYYCERLGSQFKALNTAKRTGIMNEIAADFANILAAWRWAIDQNDIDLLSQAIHTLCEYFEWSHRAEEGDIACRLATSQLEPDTSNMADYQRLIVNILIRHSGLNRRLGRTKIAYQTISEALALIDAPPRAEHDTRLERALAYRQLGWLTFDEDDLQAATKYHEESLAHYSSLNDTEAMATSLNMLGAIALTDGDLSMAMEHYLASLELARLLEERDRLAATLRWVGSVAKDVEDISNAKLLYEEALALYQDSDMARQALDCLFELHDLAKQENDTQSATSFASQGLALAESLEETDIVQQLQLWIKVAGNK